jgi:hypothetical protein
VTKFTLKFIDLWIYNFKQLFVLHLGLIQGTTTSLSYHWGLLEQGLEGKSYYVRFQRKYSWALKIFNKHTSLNANDLCV